MYVQMGTNLSEEPQDLHINPEALFFHNDRKAIIVAEFISTWFVGKAQHYGACSS